MNNKLNNLKNRITIFKSQNYQQFKKRKNIQIITKYYRINKSNKIRNYKTNNKVVFLEYKSLDKTFNKPYLSLNKSSNKLKQSKTKIKISNKFKIRP